MNLDKFAFDSKEMVRYIDPRFGSGNGCIVGYYDDKIEGKIWIIYPKNMLKRYNYLYMCIACKEKNVISTPF